MRLTLKDIERLKQAGKIKGYSISNGAEKCPKKAKYGNRKVIYDGMQFDSLKEGNRYLVLRARKLAGEISGLTMQTEFELTVNGEKVCVYRADFCYYENGKLRVEDVKSAYTRRLPVYRLKKKLMQECLGIEIQEV